MSYQPPQQQYNYGAPPPRKSSPWPWIIGFGCGLPVVLVAGCVAWLAIGVQKVVNDPEFKKAIETATKNKAAEKTTFDPATLRIVKDPATGLMHAKGVIKNKTDEKIPFLIVTFSCLDAEGNQIDTATDSISDLGAKGQWKFDAAADDKAVKSMRLGGISTAPLDIQSGGGKTTIRFNDGAKGQTGAE